MDKKATVQKITELAERLGGPEGIEVVDVELLGGGKARLLRITIDKPAGGVSHKECEWISHQVGAALDAGDIIPGDSYHLEVSSPGVERKLVRPRDYERFVGQKVKLAFRDPVDNQKRWEGTLASFADGKGTLEGPGGKRIEFALEQVEKANLKFDW